MLMLRSASRWAVKRAGLGAGVGGPADGPLVFGLGEEIVRGSGAARGWESGERGGRLGEVAVAAARMRSWSMAATSAWELAWPRGVEADWAGGWARRSFGASRVSAAVEQKFLRVDS